jgi:hypothetical protein
MSQTAKTAASVSIVPLLNHILAVRAWFEVSIPCTGSAVMSSQTIAAAFATIIGLALAAYAFAYVSFGDTYKSGSQAIRVETKVPVVQAMPIVKGPVVRDLPLPENR